MKKFDTDEKIERAMRYKGLEPIVKVQDRNGTIYIGDGFVDQKEAEKWGRSDEYPNGYFQTMWMWAQDKVEWGLWFECDPYHDFDKFGMNRELKQRARVNRALEDAR